MTSNRDSSTIIERRDRTIGVDRDVYLRGKLCHRFVDRVVDNFVHQVMKPANRRIADVHRRTLANMLHIRETFQFSRTVIFCFIVAHKSVNIPYAKSNFADFILRQLTV